MADQSAADEQVARIIAATNAPDFQQRLAEAEAARTDPWRWYCRLCGTGGEHEDRTVTYDEAMAHVADDRPCGRHGRPGEAQSGRLLHVWTY